MDVNGNAELYFRILLRKSTDSLILPPRSSTTRGITPNGGKDMTPLAQQIVNFGLAFEPPAASSGGTKALHLLHVTMGLIWNLLRFLMLVQSRT